MNWEKVYIKNIAEQIRGVSYKPTDVSATSADGYTAIFRANNITSTGLKTEDLVYIKNVCISDKQILRSGDILIAASSGSKSIVGKAVSITFNPEAAFGAFCKVIRPNAEKINPRYLGHFFQSTGYRRRISELAEGANINNIRNEDIDDLEIPLPPLHIQEQIADTLDKADALRRKDQELLQKYDELAQAIFYDMFGDPVKNDKSWTLRSIGSLSEVSSGATPSREKDEYYGGDIPWVKTGEVNGKRIFKTEETLSLKGIQESSCKIYPSGSIIVAMYGQGKTRGQVGYLECQATTNQACAVIKPSLEIDSNYLFYLLKYSYNNLRDLGRGGVSTP